MAIFCRHPKSVIVTKSNVIQFDQSGFPMRLETMECLICGKKYYACSIVTAISVAATKQYYCLTTMVVPLAFMLMDEMFFGGRR